MKNIGEFLNLLPKAKKLSSGEWQATCPSHEDKHASLSVKQEDTKILIHCHAGCQPEDICNSLHIALADLFIDTVQLQKLEGKIVATYDYLDENRNHLFQVVRYDPKSFRQRHKNGSGEWVWDTKNIRKVLYHLPDILREWEYPVYLVEGEKDADNLWEWGQVATTCPGGANAWKPEYANYLVGKKVVIIPDNDAAGYELAKQQARSLISKVRELKCILLKEHKDISDWLKADNDVINLPVMEQDISVLLDSDRPDYKTEDSSVVWHKTIKDQIITLKAQDVRQERTGIHARISILCDYVPLAWSLFNIERSEDRVRLTNQSHSQLKGSITEAYNKDNLRRDLDAFCHGLWEYNLYLNKPEYEYGDETIEPLNFLLYPYILEGGGTILFAPPGRGKSNSALLWAVSIQNGINTIWHVKKSQVLFINLERSGKSIRRRLSMINKVLGLPATQPLFILNARGKSLYDIIPVCQKAIKQNNVNVVILDSISRAGYGDLTENKPVNAIIDSLSGLCETWVALAHTPRQDENHIFGGIHFDAGADIVCQLTSETKHDGTLGIGYEITKSNDLPKINQQIIALEFGETGLLDVRKAKSGEFPEIEGKSKKSMRDTITEYMVDKDSGDANATEIVEKFGYNRSLVSRILNQSGLFTKTRTDGRKQFWGVLEH